MTKDQLYTFYHLIQEDNPGAHPIALRELEEELGTPLVDPRDKEHCSLTLAGRLLFQLAGSRCAMTPQ